MAGHAVAALDEVFGGVVLAYTQHRSRVGIVPDRIVVEADEWAPHPFEADE